MDWSLLIVFLLIIFFIFKTHTLNTRYYVPNNMIKPLKYNTDSDGFIKPEHRLIHILNQFSAGDKVELNGSISTQIFTKDVIYDELNDFIINNLKLLIKNVNNISSTNYYVKTIENLYVQTDKKQNKRFIVDFFIYDINNYYTIRLLTDFAIIDNIMYVNLINILSGSNVNIINKYDYKFNSRGILLDIDMFTNNIDHLLNTHYRENYNIVGVNSDTELEYSKSDLSNVLTLDSLNNVRFPSNISKETINNLKMKDLDSYLEIYSPLNVNNLKSPQFCEKYLPEWDNLGIPLQKPYEKSCIFHNSSTRSEFNEPFDGPTTIYNRVSNDRYEWLKDPSNGNIMKSAVSS